MSDKAKITIGIISLVLVVASLAALAFVVVRYIDDVSKPVDAYTGSDTAAEEEVTVNSYSETKEEVPTATPGQALESFDIRIISISGDGLSREVVSSLTNNGDADVHNTRVKIQVYSGEDVIKLNGSNTIVAELGTVKAGETVETTVTASFSVLDGLKVTNNGAVFYLTVYSDEKTETLRYDYTP